MKKIEWFTFHLYCRDASDGALKTTVMESWAPETAKLLVKHDFKTALDHLTKAAAELGYELVKSSPEDLVAVAITVAATPFVEAM